MLRSPFRTLLPYLRLFRAPPLPPYLQFRWQGIYVDLVSLPSKPAEVEDNTEFLVTRVHSHFGEVFASVSAPVFPLEVAAFIPMFRGPGREDL
ncbi:MAG: hypothetical protein E6L08_09005 [Verrucomicrobia bacterium]|nr:MAG: hypothetical protein E6L08_09005 [Verrucomicrobiota bacterium]HYT19835.1 hypothetical protein [Candidatus Polarisedimenticolia bacterium]